jgi:hypothetical protein
MEVTYHTMTLELRVCVQNAVCRGVIPRRIHRIGTCLVEGSLSPRISFVQCFSQPDQQHTGNRTSLVSVPVIVTIVYVERCCTCYCEVWFREFRS